MSWYQPLLDKLWNHMLDDHKEISQGEHAFEYRLTEEYLAYEKFGHAEREYLSCPWADCKWCVNYTINFDLLVREEE